MTSTKVNNLIWLSEQGTISGAELSRQVSLARAQVQRLVSVPIKPAEVRLGQRSRRFHRTRFEDLTVEQLARPALVKGLLPQTCLAMLYGPAHSGKSFLALHLALSVGRGQSFLGRKARLGHVVYIASENPGSVLFRLAGIRHHQKIDRAEITVIDGALRLLDRKLVGDLIRQLREIRKISGSLAAVVIDTVAQAMPGEDENASAAMGGFVEACQRIQRELDTCVLVVHHSGKDVKKGPRGHSLLHAAVDVELQIQVTPNDLRGMVTVTKSRDGEVGRPVAFQLVQIEIGRDEDGEAITTCMVEPSSASASSGGKQEGRKRLGKNQKIALEALRDAQEQHGMQHGEAATGSRAVTKEDWRRAFTERAGVHSSHCAARFSEAAEGLEKLGIVASVGDLYWPVHELARATSDATSTCSP